MGALKRVGEWLLVKQAQLGDKEAFGKLYVDYTDKIFRFIFFRIGQKKELAEDLTADVFMKAWEKLDTFKKGSFQAWLYMIARNHVIDYYRSASAKHIQLEETIIDDGQDVEEKALQHVAIDQIKQAMEYLTSDQKELIILRFVEDMDNKEIARILEKKEDAIRAMQYRAIKELKRILNSKFVI